MQRIVCSNKTAAVTTWPTELATAIGGQLAPTIIYNAGSGRAFVSSNASERAKTSATLIAELASYETASNPAASNYTLGAFYMPGWMQNDAYPAGNNYYQPDPWAWVRPYYPERKPLMGEYADNVQDNADHHCRMAKAYGIDWLSINWFCHGVDGADTVSYPPRPAEALACFLASTEAGAALKITILWDSNVAGSIDKDTGVNASSVRFLARFDAVMITLAGFIQANSAKWVTRSAKYVLFVRGDHWQTDLIPRSGLTQAQLVTRMRTVMAAASATIKRNGLHISVWIGMSGFWLRTFAQAAGFDSATSYGYYAGLGDKDGATFQLDPPTSFSGLSALFATENKWVCESATNTANTIKFILPISGGRDDAAIGGGTIGRPSVSEFQQHLIEQKAILDTDLASGNSKAQGWAVLATWNEHTEGSAMMPTVSQSYSLVQKIRDVLKP